MDIEKYENFLIQPEALNFEKATSIYNSLISVIDLRDNEQRELFSEFIKVSVVYSSIRAKWLLMTKNDKEAIDNERTIKHNQVILSLKVLVKYLEKIKNIFLPDLHDFVNSDRKAVGDFACYVAYIYSLNAR